MLNAIIAANADQPTGGCPAGIEADTITLPAGSTQPLNSALPAITSDVAILGPAGDKVIISGGGAAPLGSAGRTPEIGLTKTF